MQFSSCAFLLVAAAMAMILSPAESFQPMHSVHRQRQSSIAYVKDEDNKDFFAGERLEAEMLESTSIPQPEEPAVPATAAPVATAAAVSTSSLEARTMDEGIYGFNKKLIDTVYDIICFLYPVKGNERDFARFYVLETVARVPYFAYLSVMHLRETFGERYDSMSERWVLTVNNSQLCFIFVENLSNHLPFGFHRSNQI